MEQPMPRNREFWADLEKAEHRRELLSKFASMFGRNHKPEQAAPRRGLSFQVCRIGRIVALVAAVSNPESTVQPKLSPPIGITSSPNTTTTLSVASPAEQQLEAICAEQGKAVCSQNLENLQKFIEMLDQSSADSQPIGQSSGGS